MRLFQRGAVAASFLLAIILSQPATAQTVYVRPDGLNGGGHTGTSMAASNAWQTLAYAIDQLNLGGAFTEIHVARGSTGHTYSPGPASTDTFLLTKPVIIRGGYVFTTTTESRDLGDVSTLSGDLGGTPHAHNRHIMTIARMQNDVTLEGLRFVDGDARGVASITDNRGGAIFATADTYGGEDFKPLYSGPLTIHDCEFANNGAHVGGAVFGKQWVANIRDCRFQNNEVSGNPPPFYAEGEAWGGAIDMEISYLSIKGTRFEGNHLVSADTQGGGGGAISARLEMATILICVNCEFVSNSSVDGTSGQTDEGGAVYSSRGGDPNLYGKPVPTFVNCLFNGNSAGNHGGALSCPFGVAFYDCTLAENHATIGAGGGFYVVGSGASGVQVTVRNSILWGNEAAEPDEVFEQYQYAIALTSLSPTIQYSCIEASVAASGAGNIKDDPLFSDGEFRLSYCSPAVDAGDGTLLLEDKLDVNDNSDFSQLHPWDLDHMRRFVFDDPTYHLDMGAYQVTCQGDINRDGEVDGADLGSLLAAWGTCPLCPADFNCDGNVDGGDLGTLLGDWGTCGDFETDFMGGGGSELAALMSYMGVDSMEDLVKALQDLTFGEMSEVLGMFMGIE